MLNEIVVLQQREIKLCRCKYFTLSVNYPVFLLKTMSENKLMCYNRACGQMFDPATNAEDSCLHHPGMPVFHDAYKKWSCCDKKTTDFTDFLNFKGCTKSYHSNLKPPTPEKAATQDVEIKNSLPTPLEQIVVLERPDFNIPLVPLTSTIGSSLKPVLEKMLQEITLAPEAENDHTVQPGTPCQNKGCRESYQGEHSNAETCLYHNGMPVFHEGMKYWSCCIKRTTDFNSFLEQAGCTTGSHKWHKDKIVGNNTQCRYDWHQTGNNVIISVYSKCPLPDLSFVEANPVRLHMKITFGKDKDVFDQEIILHGIIDLTKSSVTYLGSKVEIKLTKAESVCWKNLTLRNIMNLDNLSIK